MIKFICFFALGMVLRFITERAPTPENSQDLWYALPAFLVFILFFLGMCSWGAWIRTKAKLQFFSHSEDALFDLSVGSVLAYVFSYLLTPISLFSSSSGIVLWVLLAAGFALGMSSLQLKKWFDFGDSWYSKFFMFLVPLLALTKLLEGIQFHQHGDSYVTYLVGPRLWAESGSFKSFLNYSTPFICTSWEALFAWGTALMGFRGGAGLDIAQWFCQWVTSGIGVFGSMLAVLAFCRRLSVSFPLSSVWYPIISISSLQVVSLRWTQNLAKNDFGLVFWGLAAFYFSYYAAAVSPVFAFVAGMLTGAMVVGKFTLLFFGVFLSLFVILTAKKNAFSFIGGGLVGCLPVLLRNTILTQNPVFPWLTKFFPSTVLSYFANQSASATVEKSFLISDLPWYLKELQTEVPLVLLSLLVLFFVKNKKEVLRFLAIPAIAFLAFTVFARPSTGIRYQNVALILFSLFSIYSAFFILNFISEKVLKQRKNIALVLLSLVLVATSSFTFFTLFQIGNGKKFTTFSKRMINTNEIGGPAKLWIRSNLKPSESIISFGDVHIYYLQDYPLVEVGQSVEYGKKVFPSTLDEAESIFKQAPFDYLYLAGEDYYKDATFAHDQAMINDMLKRTSTWKQACKKYESPKAQVWDLKCLRG